MTDAGFFVGLGLLALFLIGSMVYMLISGHRPGMRDLDGGDTRAKDKARQAELYERPRD